MGAPGWAVVWASVCVPFAARPAVDVNEERQERAGLCGKFGLYGFSWGSLEPSSYICSLLTRVGVLRSRFSISPAMYCVAGGEAQQACLTVKLLDEERQGRGGGSGEGVRADKLCSL